MKCDNCGVDCSHNYRSFASLSGDGAQKTVFCERCAVASGLFEVIGANSILSAFAGPTLLNVRDEKCQSCGINFKRFKDTGYLGCEMCYTVFRQALMPIINDVQLATKHTGKTPYADTNANQRTQTIASKTKEYNILAKQLEIAIAQEDYEEAGRIQKRMREL